MRANAERLLHATSGSTIKQAASFRQNTPVKGPVSKLAFHMLHTGCPSFAWEGRVWYSGVPWRLHRAGVRASGYAPGLFSCLVVSATASVSEGG
jgi:hypothetical protein